jgi:hypothetical protein
MFTLANKKDGFRLLLPKDFLLSEIQEKYSKILQKKRSFYINPIDFLNETIQSVDVLGFQNATIQQEQTSKPIINASNKQVKEADEFLYPSAPYTWRNPQSALSIIDMTLNIQFRHTLGYMNYMMIYENFLLQYSRKTTYEELPDAFYIDLFDERGVIYSRLKLADPIINAMDMLTFDYTQPIAQNESFKVEFKYSNFDFETVEGDE